MSNTSKTIEYLQKDPDNRFLVLTNLENNQRVGKAAIHIDEIPESDLTRYIKTSLGPVTQKTQIWVELRVKQGNSSRKFDAYKVEINPVIVQEPVNNLPAVQTPQPQPVQQLQVHAAQPDYLGAGGLGQSYGLGQIIDMHTKANRLTDKETELAEKKEDIKELKRLNNILDDENRVLKTKLSTSDAQKEMAVMMIEAKNKSFFDSPAFEKMMDKAPEVIAGIVAMKTGGVATGALGAGATEIQNDFIQLVTENLTDPQIQYMGAIIGLMSNQAFVNELQQLITRHHATN